MLMKRDIILRLKTQVNQSRLLFPVLENQANCQTLQLPFNDSI